MKIRALAVTGEGLEEGYLQLGWTVRSKFYLTVDREYDVHGICLVRGVLEYLVEDDTRVPQWYPAAAFDLTDDRLPRNWHHCILSSDSLVDAVWGYRELTDPQHFDALSEHNADALRLFRQRAQAGRESLESSRDSSAE